MWSMRSRAGITDSLYNLCLVQENYSSPCIKVSCARSWRELEDALSEYCLCKDVTLEIGDYIDFYINIKLVNENSCIKPTIIRIRYIVQITNGWDDFTNWNALNHYYNPTTAVPMGNTQSLFTQLAHILFLGAWKRREFNSVTGNVLGMGEFKMTASDPSDVHVTFADSSLNTIYLSSITVNGDSATDPSWVDIYFNDDRDYLFERSVNGYPNNYMVATYNDTSGSAIPTATTHWTWKEGRGDYETLPTDVSYNYTLNIYDLSCSELSFPGVLYDAPEGGTNQYSNASYIEIDPALSNQKRVQAPNTTNPSTLQSQLDPADS